MQDTAGSEVVVPFVGGGDRPLLIPASYETPLALLFQCVASITSTSTDSLRFALFDRESEALCPIPAKCNTTVGSVGFKRGNVFIVQQSLEAITLPQVGCLDSLDLKRKASPDHQTRLSVLPRGVKGLINHGNTCYFNTCMQGLFHTPAIRDFLLSGRYKSKLNKTNIDGSEGRLIASVEDLFFQIQCGSASPVSPRDVKRVFDDVAPLFRGSLKHDAQEAFVTLVDTLIEDTNCVKKKSEFVYPEREDNESDEKLSARSMELLNQTRVDSPIHSLLAVTLKKESKCKCCGTTSTSFELETCLELTIPLFENGDHPDRCQLSDCLEEFQKREIKHLDCAECNERVDHEYQRTLFKTPDVLTVHINRTRSDKVTDSSTGEVTNVLSRINTIIELDVDSVDLSEHVTMRSEEEDCKYKVSAIMNHIGSSPTGGHYTTYARNNATCDWIELDDAVVLTVDKGDLVDRDNTLIMMSRVKSPQSNPLRTQVTDDSSNSDQTREVQSSEENESSDGNDTEGCKPSKKQPCEFYV